MADCDECRRLQQQDQQQEQPFPFVRRRLWRRLLTASSQHTAQHGRTAEDFRYDYSLDPYRLKKDIRHCFKELSVDDGLRAFLRQCYERHARLFPFFVDLFSFHILRIFMSPTTTNALCFRGGMYVLSKEQLRLLLDLDPTTQLDRLLDIGAGDGGVTAELAPLFQHVDVTETNRMMRWRLAQYPDWTCHDEQTWKDTPYRFDVITCFNVLDRCELPWTLLQDMRDKLTPNGHLVVALVLPYSPYIDDHGPRGRRPREQLQLFGACYEDYINAFHHFVAQPLGMEITAIARAPYMCEGDMYKPFYLLHDFIIVLRRKHG
ncbi:hypothetical protein PTSG_02213 [Salpingoeca rosetta]|uniref:Methyltransferase-like protein 9 n=1 Tax=Salpingoeca rosetta (strain ATCC 50818 / BSB-021) TaxID=946362 RepID=F2U1J3_SALR5|nr:uncharacterized protein PTSG_02213 [Salpingoeca rosetta]EGD81495.1 hypothetical protein PTSG_02213 [Salpingoeca rosetta]|eukprot:XP_004996699.1 hypothetical protein PTSG_02213 [Salpingoeca rosetta]